MTLVHDISFSSYNTLILKDPNGKDDYLKGVKGGVLYGESLDSRYGRRISNKITQLDCDCIGLQEVSKGSFYTLFEKLRKEYTGFFSIRNNGEDEGIAIFFKTKRFDMISHQSHYFNDGTGRVILDIGLKLKENGNVSFHFITSHLDWRSKYMKQEFYIFANYISKIAGPKIVCGDFNVTPDDGHMLRLMKNAQLKDSLYGQHAPTYLDDLRLDYILTSQEITTISDSKVIGDPQKKLPSAEEPSDHLPVVATIQLQS